MTRIDPTSMLWETRRNFAMRLLKEHGRMTRRQLGLIAGWSKTMAFHVVQQLRDRGLVEQAGEGTSKDPFEIWLSRDAEG